MVLSFSNVQEKFDKNHIIFSAPKFHIVANVHTNGRPFARVSAMNSSQEYNHEGWVAAFGRYGAELVPRPQSAPRLRSRDASAAASANN